ncbi:MAG: YbjN domain-containing protein [Thermoguttaceae bacterium]|nr:YbjN domain-containing protein [Thermoguttaceae bacterium]
MKKIKEVVKAFFQDAEWNYDELNEEIIRSGIKGEESDFDLIFHCEEERQTLVLIGMKTNLIPAAFRSQVAELLTRANYCLNLGSYGMDYSDGELRFRIGVDVEGGKLSNEMVRNMTFITCRMLEQMYPCIMKLVYGNGDINTLFEEWKAK